MIEEITGRKLAELLPDPLTEREMEVLGLVAARLTKAEIAETLNYSVGTVKLHVGRLIAMMGAHNWTRAAGRAVEVGLMPTLG